MTSHRICTLGLCFLIIEAISLIVDPVVTISSTMIMCWYMLIEVLIEVKLPSILSNLSCLVSDVCDGVYLFFCTNCTHGIPSLLPSDLANSSDWLYPFVIYFLRR